MFKRKRTAEDFAEEIRTHIDLEADELRREGLSEPEANRGARRAFGNQLAAQERFYLKGRWIAMDKLLRDLGTGSAPCARAQDSPSRPSSRSLWA